VFELLKKGPWNILIPYKWVLGRRRERTGEGRPDSGEIPRRRRGPRGKGGSEAHGAPVEGLGGAWGGRRKLVGVGAEHGGGDERRRGCSGKGLVTRSGGLASRAQDEAC